MFDSELSVQQIVSCRGGNRKICRSVSQRSGKETGDVIARTSTREIINLKGDGVE